MAAGSGKSLWECALYSWHLSSAAWFFSSWCSITHQWADPRTSLGLLLHQHPHTRCTQRVGGGGTGEGKDNWYGLEPACYRVAGVLKLRKVLDPEPSVSPCKYRLQTSIGRFLYFRRMVKFNSWFFLKRKDYSTPIETIQILLSNVRCVIIKPTFDAVQEIEALYKYTISIQWPKFFRQSNFWHMRFF